MPLFDELYDVIDPTEDEERDPYSRGEYVRPKFKVNEEVGRRTIARMQDEIEEASVGGFFTNLGVNIGEFAQGAFAAASFPFRHPQRTGEALLSPVETAKFLADSVVEGYKQAYTPQEGESIPGMILRRLYEKPFDTLADASALGQIAFGGGGLVARAATMGTRKAFVGGQAARAITEAAGIVKPILTDLELDLAAKAARSKRAIDLFDAAQARAVKIDPLTIAWQGGLKIAEKVAPDAVDAIRVRSKLADSIAERSAELTGVDDMRTQMTNEAFKHLNAAEKEVIHPYIAGRVNFDRPVGEQLMTHTGEWVPLKGDTIRPDALEQARVNFQPIQDELLRLRGMHPEQVQMRATKRAFSQARRFIGKENFDPFAPPVQEYITAEVASALAKNDEVLRSRATGEMRTSLDIAKERAWQQQIDDDIANNIYDDLEEAELAIPKPKPVTPEEAMQAMGPQGGSYWPHSAETYNKDQSNIRNYLRTMGAASTYKENAYALYRAGVLEHQDPVKAILRVFDTFNKGKTWMQSSYEILEDQVKQGKALRMPRGKKGWNWKTDPDVIKGTHQPFDPARVLSDDLMEEEGQRMLIRLMEVIEDERPLASEATVEALTVPLKSNATGPRAAGGLPGGIPVGNLNYHDIITGLIKQAENGPIFRQKKDLPLYKVATATGHALKEFKDQWQPPTNPLVQQLDNVTQWWNWTNLNVRVSRVVNNVVGNTAFIAMMGAMPFTPRGMQTLVAMGKALGHKAGLLHTEEAARLAKVYDLPGIRASGLQQSLLEATGSVSERVTQAGMTRGPLAKAALAPVRTLGKWADFVANANVNVENAFRAAGMFYQLSPNVMTRIRRMGGNATDVMTLGEKVAGFASAGAKVTMQNPEYRSALKSVNRYFHDYSRMLPMERLLVRRIFPYHKFFKHSTELITRYPFEHPLQAAVMRGMGQAAMQDSKDLLEQWGLSWQNDVPPQMRESIPVARETDPRTGKPVIWMYNTRGQNPFSQMSGEMSEELLQLLNPVVKVLLEQTTGINLYRRERYRGEFSSYVGREVDENGQIVDSFTVPSVGEAFLRSFWPYQTVRELVQQGRVPTDTATLMDMVTKPVGQAFQLDPRTGHPIRKPILSPTQAAWRFMGPVPQALQAPTKPQKTARKSVVSQQLHSLYQRYPEHRARIRQVMRETSQEITRERRNPRR